MYLKLHKDDTEQCICCYE